MGSQDAKVQNREAAEETFNDVADWYLPWAERSAQKLGADPHDALSVAHDAFLYSHRIFDPDLGSFSTCLSTRFNFKIRAYVHYQRTREQKLPKEPLFRAEWVEDRPTRSWTEVRDSIHGDARVVADLALNPNIPVLMELPDDYLDYPRAVRLAVRQALREMGWSAFRVKQAFRDLVESLRSIE